MIRVINNIHFGWDAATGYPINQYIFAISDASELPSSPWTDPRDGSMHIIKGGSRSWDIGNAAMYGYKDSTWTRQFTMNGGGEPLHGTITGVPPLSFRANGKPLISWSMSGNGSQTGTPTPDAPIQPTFCGVRTANLFDKDNAVIGERVLQNSVVAEANMAHSDYIDVTGISTLTVNKKAASTNFYFYADKTNTSIGYVNDFTANVPSGAKYCRINVPKDDVDTIMLNLGGTALPFEHYGYKIPITCAGQTTPVYLGEVPTLRRIKKLVLTGEENWGATTGGYYLAELPENYLKGKSINYALCSHNPTYPQVQTMAGVPEGYVSFSYDILPRLYFKTSDIASLSDFKTYLAAQYAVGTPVVVWYVLANEQTGIVNEPLAKIGDYADELHSEDTTVTIPTVKGDNTLTVDTELQPSSMTIEY